MWGTQAQNWSTLSGVEGFWCHQNMRKNLKEVTFHYRIDDTNFLLKLARASVGK